MNTFGILLTSMVLMTSNPVDTTEHNVTDGKNYDTVSQAIRNGDSDAVIALLNNGYDVNAVDDIGFTPLMYAAMTGNTDMTRALLENGADPNMKNYYAGATALMIAAKHGHTDIARDLLGAGADPTVENYSGQTAARIASLNGKYRLARELRKAQRVSVNS